jgi:death on curing protein
MTAEPEWLALAEVIAIHNRQLAEHGGAQGLRDEGLLDSALTRPQFTWQYKRPLPDLFAMAATLAFGIIMNHPFVDGNKRTGYVACRLFLRLNGVDVVASQDDKYLAFYAVAAGDVSEDALASWLRSHQV